ncbi:NAD(P)H-dependent flavin oxidoreductase [Geodermatophilus sp. SYSU D00815]
MRTRFTQLVGCTVPVQQAPMGEIAAPALVAAVADAGAVGTLSALNVAPELLLERIDGLLRRTRGVLAVNFAGQDVDPGVVADAAARVRLVDCFWFDPSPAVVERAHGAGALVNWQVGSVEEARAAVDAGCDVVTVQGSEAGGHVRGYEPLFPLLQEVLDAVDVPVLAAGGIADAGTFAEVMRTGADGARIGTRFIATVESGAHPAYKQALVDAGDDATVITGAFAVCPLCATSPRARVLRSAVQRVARAADVVGTAAMGGRQVPVPRGAGLPPFAGVDGDVAAMALYAGTGVGAVDDVRPAAEVIAELMAAVEPTARA